MGGLYRYHSSRYESWRDVEGYTTDVREMLTQKRFDFVDPQRVFRKKMTPALHLGTYEVAIENMLRRVRRSRGSSVTGPYSQNRLTRDLSRLSRRSSGSLRQGC